MKTRSPLANPFYVALLLAAAVFCITCCAYAFWLGGVFDRGGWQEHPLVSFLRHRGERLLLIELVVVAVLTGASLATDDWWRTRGLSAPATASTSPPKRPAQDSATQTTRPSLESDAASLIAGSNNPRKEP